MKQYTFTACGMDFSVDKLTAAVVKLENDTYKRSGIWQMPSVRQVTNMNKEIGSDMTAVEALTAASKLGQPATEKLLSVMS